MPIDLRHTPLPRRRLGRTHMEVTEICVGGVAIGSLHQPLEDAEAVATVHRALELGVNYIDTSPFYGESERRIGIALQALGGLPPGLYLSTKTGSHPQRQYDYSGEATRWSVENSLRLLGVDSVDLLLGHDPDRAAVPSMEPVFVPGGALDELERMKAEGKLRAIGLGCRSHDFHRQAIRSGRFDVILTFLDYNLVSQSAASLIDEADAAGVGVLVAQVLRAGQLAGADPLADERLRSREGAEAAHQWWLWARQRDVPLQAVAVQWALRNPKIGCVLIGPRTAAEAEENVRLLSHPISQAIWDEVDERIANPRPTG